MGRACAGIHSCGGALSAGWERHTADLLGRACCGACWRGSSRCAPQRQLCAALQDSLKPRQWRTQPTVEAGASSGLARFVLAACAAKSGRHSRPPPAPFPQTRAEHRERQECHVHAVYACRIRGSIIVSAHAGQVLVTAGHAHTTPLVEAPANPRPTSEQRPCCTNSLTQAPGNPRRDCTLTREPGIAVSQDHTSQAPPTRMKL